MRQLGRNVTMCKQTTSPVAAGLRYSAPASPGTKRPQQVPSATLHYPRGLCSKWERQNTDQSPIETWSRVSSAMELRTGRTIAYHRTLLWLKVLCHRVQ